MTLFLNKWFKMGPEMYKQNAIKCDEGDQGHSNRLHLWNLGEVAEKGF